MIKENSKKLIKALGLGGIDNLMVIPSKLDGKEVEVLASYELESINSSGKFGYLVYPLMVLINEELLDRLEPPESEKVIKEAFLTDEEFDNKEA